MMFAGFVAVIFSAFAFACAVTSFALFACGTRESYVAPQNESGVALKARIADFKRFIKSPFQAKRANVKETIAALLALSPYYFMPIGSLPPFVTTRGGVVVTAVLFAAAAFSCCAPFASTDKEVLAKKRDLARRVLEFTAAFLTAMASLACFALSFGAPGDVASLSAYAAPLIWNEALRLGRVGYIALFAALAALTPDVFCQEQTPCETSRKTTAALCETAPCALLTAVFLPANVGDLLEMLGFAPFLADFIFFWLKVLFTQTVFVPLVKAANARISKRFGENARRLVPFLVLFIGSALVLANAGI